MAALGTVLSVAGSILFTPFLMFILSIIFLASIGKSLGVRRLYVSVLLKLFEYGRLNIEVAKKQIRETPSDDEDETSSTGSDLEGLKKAHKRPNGNIPNGNTLIRRDDAFILVPEAEMDSVPEKHDLLSTPDTAKDDEESEDVVLDFHLSNCFDYIKTGMESIIEDQVTSRFETEELKNWNLLTRTNRHYEFISWRLTVIWMFGFFMRYCFLLPLRVLICFIGVMWMIVSFFMISFVPGSRVKRWLNDRSFKITFRILARSLSTIFTFHNEQYRPKNGGFCVANHTTPIDVVILSTENCFSLIGQRHGGFLGILQRALARASPHIWFERSEVKDRSAVAARLRQHVSDPKNPPILIFPEGTCINNTSVMQFKKGSFEVGGVIYPVAIKYDPKFGDAFWNSSRYSMLQYLYMMMSSWAIVCDVWYLPPMYRQEGESAIDFASRVKAVIAKQGGLVDLVWDGQLKRVKPKKEWREKQQEIFSKRLKGE